MTARWIANALLLLLLLGLGLAIHHVLTVTDPAQTLTGIVAADLRVITVERDGEPRIQLERAQDGWRLREPLDLDADPGQVERLLSVLTAPVQRSFPAQSASLRELGLDPPRLRLTLDNLTLGFGGLDPLGSRRYVYAPADGLVHLIEDGVYPRLIAPPIDYYSHKLLPRGQSPIYAALNGVALSAHSLKTLTGLTAERVEPMTEDLSGEPLQVKFGDGALLRFVVSANRRHWTRLDLKLRYVLSDSLLLELDPSAVDPGPPGLPPSAAAPRPTAPPTRARTEPAARPTPPTGAADPFAPSDEFPAMATPEPGTGAPPVVRLSPDQPLDGNASDPPPRNQGPPAGFGAEPYKAPPAGFGIDPFAPQPGQDPPDANDAPPPTKTPKAEITPSLRRH